MESMDSTKMGANSSAENTKNNPEFLAKFVCLSPKFLDFDEKGFIGRP
jgi:hypothetical protein